LKNITGQPPFYKIKEIAEKHIKTAQTQLEEAFNNLEALPDLD
jgi:hypothetical protein